MTEVETFRNDSLGLIRLFSALGNGQTGLGTLRDKTSHAQINAGFIPLLPHELSVLPRKSAVLRKAIELYPKDAAEGWCEFVLGTAKITPSAITDYMRDLKDKEGGRSLREAFKEASVVGRQHGDGFVLLGVADGKQPWEPIDYENIQSLRWAKPLNKYQLYPELGGLHTDWHLPQYYRLNLGAGGVPNEDGQSKVSSGRWHSSRVLRFPGDRLYDDAIRYNNGFNDSILQAMFDAWSRYMQGLLAGSNMLADYSQFILYLRNLAQQLKQDADSRTDKNQQILLARLLSLDMGRSVTRSLLLDQDNEKGEYVNRSYAGADGILEALADEWAAAADMPRFKLLGVPAKSALSSNGQNERFEWDCCVSSWRSNNWGEPLERVGKIILLAKDSPTGGKMPDGWGVTFPSILKLSRTEEIDLQYKAAQRDAINARTGIYSADEARSQYAAATFTGQIVLKDPSNDHADFNYIKRRFKYGDLTLGIEFLPGDKRFTRKLNGMGYGHIQNHIGADGEALDCYVSEALIKLLDQLADKRNSERKAEIEQSIAAFPYFRISQLSAEDGDFDEFKFMLGFPNLETATSAYQRQMPAKLFGGCQEIDLAEIAKYRKSDLKEMLPGGVNRDQIHKDWNAGLLSRIDALRLLGYEDAEAIAARYEREFESEVRNVRP